MPRPLKRLGTAIILVGVILTVVYVLFYQELFCLLQRFFSSDGVISSAGERVLTSAFFFLVTAMTAVGILLIKAENAAWRRQIRLAFWEDPILQDISRWAAPRRLFFASSLVGVILVVVMIASAHSSDLWNLLYQEDGILESLTAVLFVVASFVLLKAVISIRGRLREPGPARWLAFCYSAMALLFFAYAMEEISWGQRIFGWGTPSAFEDNLQNETNLHNYIGYPFPFLYIYIGLAVIPLVIIFSIWLSMNGYYPVLTKLVLPAPYMLGLGIIIGFIAIVYYQEQELLEELLSVFVFFYSLRISHIVPAYFGPSSAKIAADGRAATDGKQLAV